MSPVSATYWGISGYYLFWGVTVLAAGLFFGKIYRLARYMFLGQKEGSFGQIASRTLAMLAAVVGQWCQLKILTRQDRASIGHLFMAWGFFTFSLFYFLFIVLGAGFGLSESLEHTRFFFNYAWVMDIMAVLVMTGALWGIIRRYIVRPPRLEGEHTFEAMVILLSVLVHPLTHLFKEATSIALGHPPVGLGTVLPPVSSALSNLFANSAASSVEAANVAFFWAHWLTVLFVLVFIAYSRYIHVVASIFNIFFQSPFPKGTLRTIDLETAESFGASKITDFTWKQLLDLYSCVLCGQCQEQCPATASGKPLNPKKLIQDLKKHLLTVGPALLKSDGEAEASPENADQSIAGTVVTEEEIWACTTCRACDDICPLYVDHIDKIVDMRRNLVMERSQMPEPVQQALQCLSSREHPWRGTTATRTDWADGLDVKVVSEDSNIDILYWVGCTAALDDRNMKVSAAVAQVLQAAGVNFGILGAEESCCGEPARRMGDEYLFQTLCEKNIATLNSYNVKKIVTTCPHCFNTLKREYPQFSGDFEVIHHTQFILDLIREGKLKIGSLDEKKVVAYHDSCYLGRYNGIYKQPREILKSLSGLKTVELPRAKSMGFCCGGGGGHMWMEEEPDQRVNVKRTEQVIDTKAELVATACPYCLSMFEDGLKTKEVEEQIQAKDLSELVLEALVHKAEG
ncbi:heterodisulfide reductase-related iron-sulfur binding cluster [Chloroflexota bacterium]